jgi:hypothetical protein
MRRAGRQRAVGLSPLADRGMMRLTGRWHVTASAAASFLHAIDEDASASPVTTSSWRREKHRRRRRRKTVSTARSYFRTGERPSTQKLKTSKAAKPADTVLSVIAKKMNAPSLMPSSVTLFYDSCSL